MWFWRVLILSVCFEAGFGGDVNQVIRSCNKVVLEAIEFAEMRTDLHETVNDSVNCIAATYTTYYPKCPEKIVKEKYLNPIRESCYSRKSISKYTTALSALRKLLAKFSRIVHLFRTATRKAQIYGDMGVFKTECTKIAISKDKAMAARFRLIKNAQLCAKLKFDKLCSLYFK